MNTTIGRIWSLPAASCRRLLSLAWVTYSARDQTDDLRRAVREAHADGAISALQIASEAGVPPRR